MSCTRVDPHYPEAGGSRYLPYNPEPAAAGFCRIPAGEIPNDVTGLGVREERDRSAAAATGDFRAVDAAAGPGLAGERNQPVRAARTEPARRVAGVRFVHQ